MLALLLALAAADPHVDRPARCLGDPAQVDRDCARIDEIERQIAALREGPTKNSPATTARIKALAEERDSLVQQSDDLLGILNRAFQALTN